MWCNQIKNFAYFDENFKWRMLKCTVIIKINIITFNDYYSSSLLGSWIVCGRRFFVCDMLFKWLMQSENSAACSIVHVNVHGVIVICLLLVLASHVHFVMDLNELYMVNRSTPTAGMMLSSSCCQIRSYHFCTMKFCWYLIWLSVCMVVVYVRTSADGLLAVSHVTRVLMLPCCR